MRKVYLSILLFILQECSGVKLLLYTEERRKTRGEDLLSKSSNILNGWEDPESVKHIGEKLGNPKRGILSDVDDLEYPKYSPAVHTAAKQMVGTNFLGKYGSGAAGIEHSVETEDTTDLKFQQRSETSPGANKETMGKPSAEAMSIGTGGSQQDKYSSSYKTPNYTQYTDTNFKEFMPDYKSMMKFDVDSNSTNSSLGVGGIPNFMDLGSMMKSFLELQKQQAEADKEKASLTDSSASSVDLNSHKLTANSTDKYRNFTTRSWPGRHGNISIGNIPMSMSSAAGNLPPVLLHSLPFMSSKQSSSSDFQLQPQEQYPEIFYTTAYPDHRANMFLLIEMEGYTELLPLRWILEEIYSGIRRGREASSPPEPKDGQPACSDKDKMLLRAEVQNSTNINIKTYLLLCQHVYIFRKGVYLDLSSLSNRTEAKHGVKSRKIDIELKESNLPRLVQSVKSGETVQLRPDFNFSPNQAKKLGKFFESKENSVDKGVDMVDMSAGGGIEYGKHEGGGLSLKLKIKDDRDVQGEDEKQEEIQRTARQDMMNLFFTW